MPISGDHMPAAGGGGAAFARVGIGAVIGSLEEALVALYCERRCSLSFWSCRALVCANDIEDMAFGRSLFVKFSLASCKKCLQIYLRFNLTGLHAPLVAEVPAFVPELDDDLC